MKYQSRDVRHVPTPDPNNWWDFVAGQERTIGTDLAFRVDTLHADHIKGTQTLGTQVVQGELWLDAPVVITRDAITNEPHVTLTLRAVDENVAGIQVTAHPRIAVVNRPTSA